MAETVRIPARSNNGCWTCRLRRKKCDESRPVCSACIALDLQCHGYGPRPEWMDNGMLQREQAAKVRRVVSLTKSRKGRRQQSHSIRPPHVIGDTLGLLWTGFESSPPAPSPPNPVAQHLSALSQDEPHHQASGIDFGLSIDPTWNLWPFNDISSIESPFDREGYNVTPTTPQNQYTVHPLVSTGSSEGTLWEAANFPILHEGSEIGSDFVPQKDIQFTNDERTRSFVNQWQGSVSHHDKSRPKEPTPFDYVGSSQVLTLGGGTEDELFMYYLDQVFYVQAPFYRPQNKKERGWLFSILRRVKSAYHAALALSERHLLSTPSPNNDIATSLVQLRTQNGHYDLAIQETQTMLNDFYKSNGRARLICIIEILTSCLLLTFCEIFNGGRANWQTHLRIACKFVSALLQARRALTTPDPTCPDYTGEQPADITLHPEVECAITVLLGSFISFDIISSASTRSASLLNIDHVQVLDTLGISLQSITGCRNSVMALILEISLLDKWKKEAQDAHKLSIVDLAKRGSQIQERLRQEVAAMEDVPSDGSPLSNPSGIMEATSHPEVSKIFALSAVTYLHVVISGAYPELPEIAESVSETILAFRSLKDPRLLRNMVWPFCISGCLALEKQYYFFRDIALRAGITQWSTGTCFEALQIMEECWKARVISSESCDWATTMKRRGHYVLLA